jgi:hypothetical protein
MLKQCKLVQFDEALCKWLMVMCSEGKFVTEAMIIKKDKSFCDEVKLTEVHIDRGLAAKFRYSLVVHNIWKSDTCPILCVLY